MIDDLTTLGTVEPYRMFTSRAEFRLLLRADNADLRLTERGIAAGCVGVQRQRVFTDKKAALEMARSAVSAPAYSPQQLKAHGFSVNMDGVRRSLMDLVAMPDVGWAGACRIVPELADTRPDVVEQIEIEARYRGYIDRQDADIRAFRKDESLTLPAKLEYADIGGLSTEVRTKLAQARPATLGAAARIPGVTPAALTALLRHVKKSPSARLAATAA